MDDIIQEYIAHLSVSEPSGLPERLQLFGWIFEGDRTVLGFVISDVQRNRRLDLSKKRAPFFERHVAKFLMHFRFEAQGICDSVISSHQFHHRELV